MKQLTVRGVSEDLGRRLNLLAQQRGMSVNALVVSLLEEAVGVDHRRERLRRYMTWNEEDRREFERVLESQRRIDDELWT